MTQGLIPRVASNAIAVADAVAEPQPRQCGRCRKLFAGHPTVDSTGQPEWWVCAACRAVLLPNRAEAYRSA